MHMLANAQKRGMIPKYKKSCNSESEVTVELSIYLLKYPHLIPIAANEIAQFRDAGYRPAKNVEQIQGQDRMEMGENRKHPNDPENARAQDHNDGGHHAAAQAPGGGDGAVHERGKGVGTSHHL